MVALDTYYGFGPIAGLSMLLGNWRHLAVSAKVGFAPRCSGRWTRRCIDAASC